MFRTDKIVAADPMTAALRLSERIEPRWLGLRLAEQVEVFDYRGATILCRRALGAGRAFIPENANEETGLSPQQCRWLKQILMLVDGLRIQKRRGAGRGGFSAD